MKRADDILIQKMHASAKIFSRTKGIKYLFKYINYDAVIFRIVNSLLGLKNTGYSELLNRNIYL